jgi:hypothetical protein
MSIDEMTTTEAPTEARRAGGVSIATFGGFASLAAGAVHAAAAGIHAEHVTLTRIFVALAAAQIVAGLWAVLRQSRLASAAVMVVNGAAVLGWLTTRLFDISSIAGLETREAPQFADTMCALLGAVAVVAAYTALLGTDRGATRRSLVVPSVVLGGLAVWTMLATSTHAHSTGDAAHAHGDTTTTGDATAAAADVAAVDGSSAIPAGGSSGHDHGPGADHDHGQAITNPTSAGATQSDAAPQAEPVPLPWPRPWDPAEPIDLSGVPGVSVSQELRSMILIEDTLRELPRFADPADAIAAGYTSIGDAGTGSEHFINSALIDDDVLLDPSAPESLVYSVVDGQRTLAGAMFIASPRPADDPSLTEWAGPLMTWHKHDNLCWDLDANGEAKVVGVIDAQGNCARGIRAGGESPMVHVWITPHPCGVFAALEGVGAGTAAITDDNRVDMCAHTHGTGAVLGG